MTARHRLSDLLGMRVRYADGRDGAQVIDVRLEPSQRTPGPLSELVVKGLVIGQRRPGTLFGYDRHPAQGPWAIRQLVRLWHRNSGYLSWDDVERLDWAEQVVHLRVDELRRLEPAGASVDLPRHHS